ncbi:MAG: hypothetical protein IKA22_13890, partial [Lentisphaeria bacterium]|nr:hypothetical protein [Lentisphaeria bacterium]
MTCLTMLTFFLQKESNKEKLFSFQILPLFEARCSLQRHLRLFTIFSQMAYPSPLKAARPSTDSLRSPTPGRLASVNLAARQFLAIAYFASLVTASDLAALTALYLLRESFKLLIFLKFLIVCHALPHAS